MNIKLFILTLIVGCISTVAFGQYPYKQKLGGLATVMLPDSPTLTKVEGISIYLYKNKGVMYIAQMADVEGGLRELLNKNDVDSLYESYIRGLLKRTNSKTFYKNKIKINGLNGIEFGYKTNLNGYDTYGYQQAVCLNDSLVSCGIWASNLLSYKDKNLKVFFDGFKVIHAGTARQGTTTNLAYKSGKLMGTLMVLCIPVLIGLGIVFLIRKIAYEKKNE